jgi:hypothetical protein
MAVWTFLMGSAAIVGVLLSAFGVFLVWTTFTATRRGNEIAREVGEAQTRAYISVTGIKANVTDKGFFEIEFNVKNFGQSPARFLHCVFAVHDGRQYRSNDSRKPQIWAGSSVFHIAAGQEKEVPRHQYLNISIADEGNGAIGKIAVFGKDVHDREIFETVYFPTHPEIEGAAAGQFSTIMNDSLEYANVIPDSLFNGKGWHSKWLNENRPKST